MERLTPRELVLTGLFAALTAVGAFLRIPLEPVPFTLQPLVVFLAGTVLRPRAALLSQLVYLGVGLAGLPVFAKGGGPAYVLQPTFGFLVGFAAAAWLTSLVAHTGKAPGLLRLGAGLLMGCLGMYACGILGLFVNLVLFQGKAGVFPTVVWGLGVYLVFDLVKVAAAAAIAGPVRAAIGVGPGRTATGAW